MNKFLVLLLIVAIFGASVLFLNKRDVRTNAQPVVQSTKVASPLFYQREDIKKIISSDPLWYKHPKLKPTLDSYFRESEEGKTKEFVQEKRAFIQMVGTMVTQGKVKLGKPIENWDEDRKPIDSLVIHHTETAETANVDYINGIHLFTLYIMPVFDNPEHPLYGKPIFSGHYDENGKQVFYGYHYLVRQDGTYKQTLKDEYVGYHAQSINPRSIGISLIGNFEEKKPSAESIAAIREIIQKYPNTKLYGHREVVPSTECPGEPFFGENGWKQELL